MYCNGLLMLFIDSIIPDNGIEFMEYLRMFNLGMYKGWTLLGCESNKYQIYGMSKLVHWTHEMPGTIPWPKPCLNLLIISRESDIRAPTK